MKKASSAGDYYSKVSLDEFSSDEEENDNSDSCEYGGGGGSRQSSGGPQQNPPRRTKPYHDNSNPASSSANSSISRQHEMLQQQDAGLEVLGQHAEKLGAMSLQISDELVSQNVVLDEMDIDFDTAHENLGTITKTTQKFIELSGGTKNFTIILCLTIIVIILILLILYT